LSRYCSVRKKGEKNFQVNMKGGERMRYRQREKEKESERERERERERKRESKKGIGPNQQPRCGGLGEFEIGSL